MDARFFVTSTSDSTLAHAWLATPRGICVGTKTAVHIQLVVVKVF